MSNNNNNNSNEDKKDYKADDKHYDTKLLEDDINALFLKGLFLLFYSFSFLISFKST